MEDEREIAPQSDDILMTAIGIPVVDVIARLENGHLFDKFGIAMDTHRPSSVALIKEIEKEIFKYVVASFWYSY